MLIHTKCQTPVVANLSEMGWKITSDFCLRSDQITFGALDILQPKKNGPVKFYCPSCESDVETSHVTGICSVCGNIHPLNELYKIPDLWGDWCLSCMNNKGFSLSPKTIPLSELIKSK